LAKAGKEIIKRLTAPEIREIVREELHAAIKPLEVKIEEMDKRLTGHIEEMDKRLTGHIEEMDKRITGQIEEMEKRLSGEIGSLRNELQYATKVAVLEAKLTELEKKVAAH
jgi:hypothetical protein